MGTMRGSAQHGWCLCVFRLSITSRVLPSLPTSMVMWVLGNTTPQGPK